MSNIYKIKLIENTKKPVEKWSDKKNHYLSVNGQYGILTGKINDIIVVDLDCYDWTDDHIFYQKFGKDIDKLFNTYTVKSPNGGYHYYFKYTDTIKTMSNKFLKIDVRSDGAYIVGEGSVINGNKYQCVNGKLNHLANLPNILNDMLITKPEKKTAEKKTAEKNETEVNIRYIIPNNELIEIVESLDKNYFINFDDWIIFTTFCKIISSEFAKELWKSKSFIDNHQYDLDKNEEHWNNIRIDNTKQIIEYVLKEVNMIDRLPYYKIKDIPKDTEKPIVVFCKEKLGYDYFLRSSDPNINYVIKSDTGTGKTTSFKHYAASSDINFLSICSRVSLCQEQYRIFINHEIDARLYQNEPFLDKNYSTIIQLDSLLRISNFEFKNHIIFMDEFNSLIEYLITSPTLYQNRVPIFRLLCKIIKEAKQIICVDADINDVSLKFLNMIGKKYEYHMNIHKHNKGIKATEITDRDTFIQMLKKENKFLLCCDSKTECKSIFNDLDTDDVKLITSDSPDSEINLDSHKKVIFSPKIIYGIDSTMKRPVYCLYKSKTISPKHMVQQINRCRNIEHIYYLYTNKKIYESKYKSIEEAKKYSENMMKHNLLEFKEMATEEENKIFFELFSMYEYINDCYEMNKLLHFKNILRERGVEDINNFDKTKNKLKTHKEIVEKDLEEFDPKSKRVNDINSYLFVPDERIEEYKEYFVDNIKLSNHYNISSFFIKSNSQHKQEEFKIKYINSNKAKINYLIRLKDIFDISENSDGYLTVNNMSHSDDIISKLENEFLGVFRFQGKKLNFSNRSFLLRQVVASYKTLFGNDIILTEKKGKKHLTFYRLNKNKINKEKDLYSFRNPDYQNNTEEKNGHLHEMVNRKLFSSC